MTLHFVCVATNWKLQPSTVTNDFKKGLHSAFMKQFKGAHTKVNGCLFCFKQDMKKNMEKLKLCNDIIEYILYDNAIDMLCIIPPDEIIMKGIHFV